MLFHGIVYLPAKCTLHPRRRKTCLYPCSVQRMRGEHAWLWHDDVTRSREHGFARERGACRSRKGGGGFAALARPPTRRAAAQALLLHTPQAIACAQAHARVPAGFMQEVAGTPGRRAAARGQRQAGRGTWTGSRASAVVWRTDERGGKSPRHLGCPEAPCALGAGRRTACGMSMDPGTLSNTMPAMRSFAFGDIEASVCTKADPP